MDYIYLIAEDTKVGLFPAFSTDPFFRTPAPFTQDVYHAGAVIGCITHVKLGLFRDDTTGNLYGNLYTVVRAVYNAARAEESR